MCLTKDGDFLFNTRNSRELVGKNAIWKEISDEIILFNNNIMRVRFITNVISIYVAYYFNSIKGKSDLEKIKKVTTNVAAIYAKDLKKILIPIPSIQEQQEIVRILDDLFAKEQNAKDLIDLIDQIEAIKKTILGQAFRGQLGTNEAREESAVELLKDMLNRK
ncbi:restriction endonuclease subunit S [Acetobacterium carbinolicum]|uniref:restriction endonuclease subunit S n=1 Tax=Acetobacterium carbinolicum TaxID=52690 RepID=UPI0039BFC4AD